MWSTRSNDQFYNIYGVPAVQCRVPTENLYDFQKIFQTTSMTDLLVQLLLKNILVDKRKNSICPINLGENNMRLLTDLTT